MTEFERERAAAEQEGTPDPDAVEQQDFVLRNTMMSNALPNTGQPAAGAVIGSEGRLPMQPETDEEIVGGDDEDRATAVESDAERHTETGTDA